MRVLVESGTFSVKQPSSDDPITPCTETYKCKVKSDGTIDKAKARFCVRGDLQEQLLTLDNWLPTALHQIFKIFLAMAAKCGATVFQLDFIGAFLQAPIKTRTFVKILPLLGVLCPKYAQYCGVPLQLLMSMYGISVCRRNWFKELHNWLIDKNGRKFVQSKCKPALFYRNKANGSITYILTHVDNSLYFNSKNENFNPP